MEFSSHRNFVAFDRWEIHVLTSESELAILFNEQKKLKEFLSCRNQSIYAVIFAVKMQVAHMMEE